MFVEHNEFSYGLKELDAAAHRRRTLISAKAFGLEFMYFFPMPQDKHPVPVMRNNIIFGCQHVLEGSFKLLIDVGIHKSKVGGHC